MQLHASRTPACEGCRPATGARRHAWRPRRAVAPSREQARLELERHAASSRVALQEASDRRTTERKAAAAGAAEPADSAYAFEGGTQAGPREITAAEFWAHLDANEGVLVCVDFYTEGCGPCKLMLPELVRIHAEISPRGGQVVKLNCGRAPKELGRTLGVKAVPTFQLYRGRRKVAEMAGANVARLRALIEAHL